MYRLLDQYTIWYTLLKHELFTLLFQGTTMFIFIFKMILQMFVKCLFLTDLSYNWISQFKISCTNI